MLRLMYFPSLTQGAFLHSVLAARASTVVSETTAATPIAPQVLQAEPRAAACDAAVGPDWLAQLASGCASGSAASSGLHVYMGCEIERIDAAVGEWPLQVRLTSGSAVDVDVVVVATGVVPSVDWCDAAAWMRERCGAALTASGAGRPPPGSAHLMAASAWTAACASWALPTASTQLATRPPRSAG